MNRKKLSPYLLIVIFILIIAFCLIGVLRNVLSEPINSVAETYPSLLQAYEIAVYLETKTLKLTQNGEVIKTYSVGVGAPSTPTPTGEYEVINKVKFPGGEYGTRWLGLSAPHIGIHGTDAPQTIGQAESGGCIRMLNEDIEDLFSYIRVGTKVTISP